MRAMWIFALSLAGLVPTAGVQAQTAPTALLAGVTKPAFGQARDPDGTVTAWCNVDAGTTTFQRAATGPAKISFQAINFTLTNGAGAPTYFTLSGQALLKFSSASAGTINFSYPSSYPTTIRSIAFSGYSQNYDSTQKALGLNFAMAFPGCAVPFSAIYRN